MSAPHRSPDSDATSRDARSSTGFCQCSESVSPDSSGRLPFPGRRLGWMFQRQQRRSFTPLDRRSSFIHLSNQLTVPARTPDGRCLAEWAAMRQVLIAMPGHEPFAPALVILRSLSRRVCAVMPCSARPVCCHSSSCDGAGPEHREGQAGMDRFSPPARAAAGPAA